MLVEFKMMGAVIESSGLGGVGQGIGHIFNAYDVYSTSIFNFILNMEEYDYSIFNFILNMEELLLFIFSCFFCLLFFFLVYVHESGHSLDTSSFLYENEKPDEWLSFTKIQKEARCIDGNDIFMFVTHRDTFHVVLYDKHGCRHYFKGDLIRIYTGKPFKFHITSDVKIKSCLGIPINSNSGIFTMSLTQYDAVLEDTIELFNGEILSVKVICLPLLPLYNPSFSKVYKAFKSVFKALASFGLTSWLLFFLFVILF